MPFSAPDDLLTTAQYKYLTIQQVIEDTAAVLAFVRKERSVPAAVPAVVIGGSYGEHFAAYLIPHTFSCRACCVTSSCGVTCSAVQRCCVPHSSSPCKPYSLHCTPANQPTHCWMLHPCLLLCNLLLSRRHAGSSSISDVFSFSYTANQKVCLPAAAIMFAAMHSAAEQVACWRHTTAW